MAAEPRRHEAAGAHTRALFERHGRMVLGLCRVLLRDAVEAEDAAQQVFVNAQRALLAGTAVREEAAWLAAIARNECRARIVARMREPLALSYDDLVEAAGAAPEEPELPSAELRQALADLPERQREAVVLRDVYGLRYREVSAALGLSRPAVESLLFRARRRLRVRLRPVAGALVLPIALRESLAQALPGFAPAGAAGAAGATAGAAGASGIIVKLGSAPFAAKIAAGAVAVGAGAGSVAVVDDGAGKSPPARSSATIADRRVADDAVTLADAVRRHEEAVRDEGSGSGGGSDDASGRGGGGNRDDERRDDSSGPGGGSEQDERNDERRNDDQREDDSSGQGRGGSNDGGSGDGGSDDSPSSGSGSGSSSSGSGSGERAETGDDDSSGSGGDGERERDPAADASGPDSRSGSSGSGSDDD